jgi:hypothetical protein
MADLHSKRDDELEQKDQSIFSRVVILAGIALILLFLGALFLVNRAGRHIQPLNPDKHPTSQVVGPAREWMA